MKMVFIDSPAENDAAILMQEKLSEFISQYNKFYNLLEVGPIKHRDFDIINLKLLEIQQELMSFFEKFGEEESSRVYLDDDLYVLLKLSSFETAIHNLGDSKSEQRLKGLEDLLDGLYNFDNCSDKSEFIKQYEIIKAELESDPEGEELIRSTNSLIMELIELIEAKYNDLYIKDKVSFELLYRELNCELSELEDEDRERADKRDVDDYEDRVMRAFRRGDQDRYGY